MKKLLWMAFLLLGYSLVHGEGHIPDGFQLGEKNDMRDPRGYVPRNSVMLGNRSFVADDCVSEQGLQALANRPKVDTSSEKLSSQTCETRSEVQDNNSFLTQLQKFFMQIAAYWLKK